MPPYFVITALCFIVCPTLSAHAQDLPMSCDAFLEKTVTCRPTPLNGAKRQALLDDCAKSIELHIDEFRPILSCGLLPSCEEFSACAASAADVFQQKVLPKDIRTKAESGDLEFYKKICGFAFTDASSFSRPDVVAACDPYANSIAAHIDAAAASQKFSDFDAWLPCEMELSPSTSVQARKVLHEARLRFHTAKADALTRDLMMERDKNQPYSVDITVICKKLNAALVFAGRPTEAAEILCEEAKLAVQAGQYFLKIQRAIDAARATPPASPFLYGGAQICTDARDLFSPLSTPFAKAKVEAIQSICEDWIGEMTAIVTHTRDHDPTNPLGRKHQCDIYVEAVLAIQGPAAQAEAQILCRERELAFSVTGVAARIEKVIAENNIDSYVDCSRYIAESDALATPFAQGQREVAIQNCFIKFNKFVLPPHLLEATNETCSPRVKKALKEANLYALAGRDPDLDALFAKARALPSCIEP